MSKRIATRFIILISLWGCASNKDVEANRLSAMEKQLLQLKAENANLQSKAKNLDDKLMVYEKQQNRDQIQEQRARKTQTIRLTPDDNDSHDGSVVSFAQMAKQDQPQEQQEQRLSFSDNITDTNSSRPVLRLVEGHIPTDPAILNRAVNSRPEPAARSYNVDPALGSGDNLGVVRDGVLESNNDDEEAMNLFNKSYKAYNNREYSKALEGFSIFLQTQSSHAFADDAMFWRGECYFAQGQLLRAIGEFERLLRRYPKSEKAASSLYRIGFIYDQLNDQSKAKEFYFRVVEQYPGSEAARKASRRMSMEVSNNQTIRTSVQR